MKINEIIDIGASKKDLNKTLFSVKTETFTKINKIADLSFYKNKKNTAFIISSYNEDKLVISNEKSLKGKLLLEPFVSPNSKTIGIQEKYLWLDISLRGKGLALELYNSALKQKVIIFSDFKHTPGTKSIWKKFVENNKYFVWAENRLTKESVILNKKTLEDDFDEIYRSVYETDIKDTGWIMGVYLK